jgi:hypothetical protein
VALRATDVAGGDDVYAPAVFDVAGCAIGDIDADLVFVVYRAVMARKARGVASFRGEFSGFLDVAGGALLF